MNRRDFLKAAIIIPVAMTLPVVGKKVALRVNGKPIGGMWRLGSHWLPWDATPEDVGRVLEKCDPGFVYFNVPEVLDVNTRLQIDTVGDRKLVDIQLSQALGWEDKVLSAGDARFGIA